MANEVPRMNRFMKEGMEAEKESVLLSVGKKRIGGAQTLQNESDEELFRELLTLT